MTTCNGMPFIKEQIASILLQLELKDEILISDDESHDGTFEFLRQLNDPRITLFRNTFHNVIRNYEFVMSKATGDIIFLSDQDDIWHKKKIEQISDLLRNYDLVVSDCEVIDDNGAIIHESFYKIMNSGKGLLKNYIRNTYLGCCVAMNRKILEKAIPFPRNIPMHDIWIGIIGEIYGKTLFHDEKLVKYRRHCRNLSCAGGKSHYSMLRKTMFRIHLAKNIAVHLIKKIIYQNKRK